MKLKSIEIKGFKSFYQKTEIEFPNGIVSIVGPNGSGKSNILDAFRWVLGEQSAKNLRGDKMEDVIFSGTARHNQSNYCEVEVVFDNQDGGLDLDFAEISIKRKAFRSGESSYYINGKQSRLKEIKELFLDSGIGKEGYSIISQGKIDEIVNSTSVQRRKLLEEASGIARFRFKKEESEKKIENSKVNLERLEDIFREIERQIEPLAAQREKALKFLELKEELTKADVSLMLKEYDDVHINHEKDMNAFSELQSEIDKVDNELEQNKESIQQLEENNNKGRELMQRLEQEKSRLHLDKNNYLNEIERHNTLIELKREQIEKSSGSQKKQQDMLSMLEESIDNNEKAKADFEKFYKAKRNEEEILLNQTQNLTSQMNTIDENIDNMSRSNRHLSEEINRHELKIQFLLENIQREKIKHDESTISIHRTREKLENLFEQRQVFEKNLAEFEAQYQEQEQERNRLTNQRQMKDEKKSELRKKLEGKNQLLREAYLKHQMYSSMERDMEGINKSVKSILSNQNLSGIIDIVSNVIATDEKYEKAIETALGASLQHIITQDSQSAKKAVEYLKKSGNGRATFLPLDAVKGNVLDVKDVTIASSVVRTEAKFQGIIDSLLGRTLIIDTMDEAIAAAKKFQYRYRIVTLDGEIFNVGGSITGGHYYKSNNILSRKRMIDEYAEQMKVLQEEVDSISEQLEAIKAEIFQSDKRIADAQQQIAQIQKSLQSEKLGYGDVKNRINYLNNTLESLLGESEGSTNQQKENQIVVEETREKLKELEEELIENRYILEDIQNEKKKLSEEMARKAENKNAIQIEIIHLKNQMDNYEKEHARLLEQVDSIRFEISEGREELLKINQEIALSENKIFDAMMNLQLCEIELDETINEFEEAQEKLQKENKKYEDISILKNKLESKRMNLMEEKFKLENRIDRVSILCEKIIERLKDEYELSLEDARNIEIEKIGSKESIASLRRRIQELGNINLDSIEDYNVLYERFETYKIQIDDLTTSIVELENIIQKLEKDMTRDFMDSFDQISKTFGSVFSKMFGGGEGKLVLSNAADVLNSEIEIFAQPPGKKLKSISVMSGGEKALMGIALLFAIQMTKPAPFCILDEIDAALDDANISRFNVFLKQMSDHIQFVTITHRRGTMENSDYIYGVTMQDKGVSKLVSLKFEDAQEYIEQ
ncbi:MAG: chromosome segregation protein SMC [Peptostreptococcaceae bacterium]|nr:chromosome segregation protein SMC [Peptostreptococcaceae bacterium]